MRKGAGMKITRTLTLYIVIIACLIVFGCGSVAPGNPDIAATAESNKTAEIETTSEETISEEAASEETTSQEPDAEVSEPAGEVILGDEQFDKYLPLLEGKRVALFTNHTGIVGDENSGIGETEGDTTLIHFGWNADGEEITYGEHILDALLERDVDVTAVFSPEHGFRGTADAGAGVEDGIDEKTGVPILSLYSGGGHSPSAADLDRFDTLLVDMQEEYKSGVGILPIPVVYGMTWGELAQMINGEGWLDAGKDACDLTVIPCGNYTHDTKTMLIKSPSPNIKDMKAVYLYASTCFLENTAVSVGRGTEYPFEIYGSPYLEGVDGFEFSFTPESMSGASDPPFEGEECYGVDLRDIPVEEIWNAGINPEYLISAYNAVREASPETSFWGRPDGGQYWIDKLSGSDRLRKMIEEGYTAEEIKASWQEELEIFKEERKPYLLY